MARKSAFLAAAVLATFLGCAPSSDDNSEDTNPPKDWQCVLDSSEENRFSPEVGCREDFSILAAAPLDASIPGARSVKTVVDRIDNDTLYFQNSNTYPLHWDFASNNLSGQGLPIVPDLSSFNATEYYSPDRRFILGAVTHYEEPDIWAYEVSPYDTASADMIETAFRLIRDNAYFGENLLFHPTSEAVQTVAKDLPDDIPIITTDELFDGIDYQPLNLATSVGRLSFYTSAELIQSYVDYRETVVLESVPNDIAIVAGIITEQFQTPLAHINVLSQNRGTPNMGLRGAFTNEELRALEGKWVELTVGAFEYTIKEVTQEEADAWWEANKPLPLTPTPMDLGLDQVVDADALLDLDSMDLQQAIAEAVPAVGGKAAHFAALSTQDDFRVPKGFIVPVFFYHQHLEDNGLWGQVDSMLADPQFQGDPEVRSAKLRELRDAIREAPINTELVELIENKILDGYDNYDYPMTRFRFRSSTNAEDIAGFNGAGLYSSVTADPATSSHAVTEALKVVWGAFGMIARSRSGSTTASTTPRSAWRSLAIVPFLMRTPTVSPLPRIFSMPWASSQGST